MQKTTKNVSSKIENPCHKRVLIMASGNGSNFEAIVKYFAERRPQVTFELVCDKNHAYVLKRAKKLGVKSFQVNFENLYDFFKEHKNYNLVVLAGFMRILPEKILKIGAQNGFSFINIHPSLLPKFKGKNAIRQAFEAKAVKTGVTVHFVNKKIDSGKIIKQRVVSSKGLNLKELEEKIHAAEYEIYPEIIENLLFKKNALILGGGAREHAIAAKIKASPYLEALYLANANDGFKDLGKNIDYESFLDLAKKARKKNVDLLIVGPENPLCDGVCDIFQKQGINVIGVNQDWARLEGSKSFAKDFMKRNKIETADYICVSDEKEIESALKKFKNPPVIKADGLALGKGVLVAKSFDEAEKTAKDFLRGQFGEASKKILLEERLFGKEISVISLWDGKNLVSFPPACDYKRLLDNDKGKNTGGMGSYAPSKTTSNQKKAVKKYLKKLENALQKENANFVGIIYSGLILTNSGPKALEYNMRFGDPETQALLEILSSDLLDLFLSATKQKLNKADIIFKQKSAYCVVLASEGYPEKPKKGAEIKFGKKISSKIYFAGVKREKNELLTNGGRVLSVVNSGKRALEKIYEDIKNINYDGKIFRKDIGK